MIISYEFDFDSFEAWSGAVDTYNKIAEAGKGMAFECLLDELFSGGDEGITETTVNDLLWFDRVMVLEYLGINDDDDDDDDDDCIILITDVDDLTMLLADELKKEVH